MPPKKVKLHKSSGKVKTLPISGEEPSQPREQDFNLELELCWCIQKLELSLASGKLSQKQAQDTEKALKVLKGDKQPVVKKRQLMRNTFGDYRAQMTAEEKRENLVSRKIKFIDPKGSEVAAKSHFVKKSAVMNSGSDFKFNFKVDDEQQCAEMVAKVEENDLPKTGVQSSSKFLSSDNSFRFNFQVDPEK